MNRFALVVVLYFTGQIGATDFHLRFARSKCGIPDGQYDINITKGYIKEPAIYLSFEPDVVTQVVLTHDGERTMNVKRKRFSAAPNTLATQFVKLDDVNVSLYETGQVVMSGMIWSNGGALGELKGNNVKITYRYLSGIRQAREVSATDVTPKVSILPTAVLHEEVIQGFVRKNEPSTLHLKIPFTPAVRQHFHEIERIEIQLQVMKDR